MKIAVDAMGGDFAPGDVIKGSVIGARKYGVGLIFAGHQARIQQELAGHDTSGLDIEIVHTDEYLVEGEQPAYALRSKRNASIAVASRLVRDGKAQALIGFGPTGGILASALTFLGTVEGISRPVIGGSFLGFTPNTVTMDLGGNLDCRPDQLLDFAIVGTVYARTIMGIENPKVALLSVGKEEGKGNEQTKATYILLKSSGLNFMGNIEGNDVTTGVANVIVCDGFVGNVIAKLGEGIGTAISQWLKVELESRLPAETLTSLNQKLINLTVPADTTGGGPIWAINGVVLKGHGRSRYPEIAQTIANAKKAVEMDIVGSLKTELARVKNRLQQSGI
jgi:glycerol-3-phosphate acyltransferase PlsX